MQPTFPVSAPSLLSACLSLAHLAAWSGHAGSISLFLEARLGSGFRGQSFAPAVASTLALLATLAPVARFRHVAGPPLPAVDPDFARALRDLQRDREARFAMASAGQGALAVEYTSDEHLVVHYVSQAGAVSIAGGWLGAGRRKYIWLPLRHTLVWDGPLGNILTAAQMAAMAADLHAGLDRIGERHVIEQFFEPIAIPEAERRQVFDSYAGFMKERGWEVTYDDALSRRSIKRVGDAESPQNWSNADREVLVRLEALLSEMLKGVRSSSRVLFQAK